MTKLPKASVRRLSDPVYDTECINACSRHYYQPHGQSVPHSCFWKWVTVILYHLRWCGLRKLYRRAACRYWGYDYDEIFSREEK